MTPIVRTVVLTVLVAVMASAFAAAQTANSGIAGVVRDSNGGVLPGVTVEAASPALIEKVRTVVTGDDGAYRILGRESVDILKTGGEKVSALEIEDVLRTHPAVADCAVVGVADPAWGDRVCAAVVPAPGAALDGDELHALAKVRLAPYKVPKEFKVVAELPRNAMGKVIKPAVKDLFGPQPAQPPPCRP